MGDEAQPIFVYSRTESGSLPKVKVHAAKGGK